MVAGTTETGPAQDAGKNSGRCRGSHAEIGDYSAVLRWQSDLLFTENETNNERIFGTPNATPYVKDAFNNYVVSGSSDAVNPTQIGTKAAAHYQIDVGAGETERIRLRLSDAAAR